MVIDNCFFHEQVSAEGHPRHLYIRDVNLGRAGYSEAAAGVATSCLVTEV